jgi:Arc/MetJ-type ribon-helix-helix transcriptional regulator
MDFQIGVRFPASVVSEIDGLVQSGVFLNRSDAVRDLTRSALRVHRKRQEEEQ